MQFSTGLETYPFTLVEDMAYDMFIAAVCLGLQPKLPILCSVHIHSYLASSTQTHNSKAALGVMCAGTRAVNRVWLTGFKVSH